MNPSSVPPGYFRERDHVHEDPACPGRVVVVRRVTAHLRAWKAHGYRRSQGWAARLTAGHVVVAHKLLFAPPAAPFLPAPAPLAGGLGTDRA